MQQLQLHTKAPQLAKQRYSEDIDTESKRGK